MTTKQILKHQSDAQKRTDQLLYSPLKVTNPTHKQVKRAESRQRKQNLLDDLANSLKNKNKAHFRR